MNFLMLLSRRWAESGMFAARVVKAPSAEVLPVFLPLLLLETLFLKSVLSLSVIYKAVHAPFTPTFKYMAGFP